MTAERLWSWNRSPSSAVRSRLDHQVIDSDVHTIESRSALEGYVDLHGGGAAVDKLRALFEHGVGYTSNTWYDLTPEQRTARRVTRPPWWNMPAKNTLDRATVAIPRLLYERLDEAGTDFAVLIPNIVPHIADIRDSDLRRALTRGINHYHADWYRRYADRMTPVAAISMHTPEEAVDDLEFAIRGLGMKVALIPAGLRRPIRHVAAKYPPQKHPDVARHARWLDTFGIDSELDYDPVWAKACELMVPLLTHMPGTGWTTRNSCSNYVYNHIGTFASAAEAFVKSLFLSGVTRRFPRLRIGVLEGGAAWAATLYADLVAHWEKRNAIAVHNYNPQFIDWELLARLHLEFDDDGHAQAKEYLDWAREAARSAADPIDLAAFDDFAAVEITRREDIRDLYVPNFYFGCESDDVTLSYAFNRKVNPFEAELNAMWASDIGHWDVLDLRDVLAETWGLVERSIITTANFRDLVFGNPYRFFTGANPAFFEGTVIEGAKGVDLRPSVGAGDGSRGRRSSRPKA